MIVLTVTFVLMVALEGAHEVFKSEGFIVCHCYFDFKGVMMLSFTDIYRQHVVDQQWWFWE